MGKGIREFKRSFTEVSDQVTQLPDERSQQSRQIDAPPQATPTSGEPKRLSQ
jgi:Sec-independent protein translocase protein TatA